uniref:SAP30 binding protein n=1 Tax=Coturnix japonica TaxID=93934 RepID=A0A8C2UDJ5_COTJA
MAAAKRSVLSSLAVYAEDSDPESDSETGTAGREKGGLVSVGYGEDDFSRLDGDEEGYEEEDDENSRQSEFSELEKRDPQELVASFSERVRNMSPDEIRIPPEPPGRCSNHLQDKIQKLYERKIKEGMDMNYIIQRKKEFRNPSIYEKLIQFCSIDELGTNYPKDMFDPHGWSEDSYYEALAKAQKIEMDKLEKAKKERTKVAVQGRERLRSTLHASFCLVLSFLARCFFQAVQMKLFALPYRSISLGCSFHWLCSCFVSIFKPELETWYAISQLQMRCSIENSLLLNL